MIKKAIATILSVLLTISFAACQKQQTASTDTITANPKKQTENSKTYEFFKNNFDTDEYTMTLKTTDEQTGIDSTVTIGIKGSIYYTDDNTAESHSTTFYKDGQTTTISHDNKTYYVNVTQDEMSSQDESFSSDDFKDKEFTTGKEKINGVEYYYEEFDDEYGIKRYCFDGDNLKYMVNVDDVKSTYIEITDLKHTFDESLLTIPEGYELLDY